MEELTPEQVLRMQVAWDYYRRGAGFSPKCVKLCRLKVPSVYKSLGECRRAECNFDTGQGNQVKGDKCKTLSRSHQVGESSLVRQSLLHLILSLHTVATVFLLNDFHLEFGSKSPAREIY